jgi:hypothetical protein
MDLISLYRAGDRQPSGRSAVGDRTYLRCLFVFDPRRCAILLIGGNKERQWKRWYDKMIPVAERLYAEHLRLLKEEGLI